MREKEIIDISITCEDEELIPSYGSAGAAGADVRANVETDLVVPAGKSVLVPTGLRVAIPEGYEIQVRPRSGLALKHQITVLNTPGTIDSDYRGEIKVILINHGTNDFVIEPKMRIAQLVVASVTQARFVHSEELVATARSSGGFGHTGLH